LIALTVGMTITYAAADEDSQFMQAKQLRDALSSNASAIDHGIETKRAEVIAQAVAATQSALATYNAPSSDEINALADALARRLSSYSGDKASIRAKLDLMEAAIATHENPRDPKFIGERAEKLKTWIDAAEWKQTSSIAQLSSLSEQLFKTMRAIDPTAAAAALSKGADLLTAKGTDSFRPPAELLTFRDQMFATRTTLDGKLRVYDPARWLVDTSGSFDDLLMDKAADSDPVKQQRASLRQTLRNAQDAMAGVAKVRSAIDKLSEGYRPLLHVVQALYGDIYQGNNRYRNCDATQAMVARCERMASCKLPDNYKTSLCGFDPIPAADDRARGVAIVYSCNIGGDSLWDDLSRFPTIDPGNGSDLSSVRNPARRYSLLRGTEMDIRCPPNVAGVK
jgi:hypothetical protein